MERVTQTSRVLDDLSRSESRMLLPPPGGTPNPRTKPPLLHVSCSLAK